MPTNPELLLVDASPYIFRAHFALPSSIVDRRGRPANATYGFGSFLLKLLAEERPTHLAVAFDRSLTTSFRNELYPEYKRQREPPPAELEAQVTDCEALAQAIGAVAFSDERYEADDLIGTLCRRFAARAHIRVVTSDKDLAQLVREGVEWYDYGKQRRYGRAEVRARFGVDPERIPDLLGLVGDPVDNIPGVPGIGRKTAVALLERFGSLEELVAGRDRIPRLDLRGAARISRLLAEHEDQALLSKRLATVAQVASVEPTWDELELTTPRRTAVDSLCERLGFDGLRARILRAASA